MERAVAGEPTEERENPEREQVRESKEPMALGEEGEGERGREERK